MQIEIFDKDPIAVAGDLLVVGIFQGTGKRGWSDAAIAVDTALGGDLAKLIEQDHYEAKAFQVLIFPTFGKVNVKRVAVIGLGDRKRFTPDLARRIGGSIVKLAYAVKAVHVVTTVHGVGDLKAEAQALAEGLHLSAYRFHIYHGPLKKKENRNHEIKKATVCVKTARERRNVKAGVAVGEMLARATILARDLVNTPSADMTPADMAEAAKDLAGGGITVKVMDRAEMERKKMGAALAVARGSQHPPFAVHLSYKPKRAKKKVAIVGKAVTFDSGGLNIKPGDGMTTMKIDMAGAASVIGLFAALKALKVPVEVHGVFIAVENMPGGSAYRPGDVVKAMDGTTIEIINTDAEGRVTLADALAYAKTLEPQMIVDLATLTGACISALGEDIAGIMTNDAKLGQRLIMAGAETGELLWELPLYEPYMEHVKSKIADLKNTGARGQAGAIAGGNFLKPFVGKTSWAHLDIAGPSYMERESRPDQPYGATGFGVRLLVRFLQKL